MAVASKIPLTLKERLDHGEDFRIPASWEEFLDLLETCDYRVEYDEGEIISFMGYATEQHETIVAEIIRLLGNILTNPDYRVNGSNLALHIPGLEKKYFNADCAVIKGSSEKIALRGSMKAIANPILIVEVLSISTEDHDLGRKFRNYRKIPSLQQILYIDSVEMHVVSHTRHNGGNDWLLKDLSSKEDIVEVLGEGSFSLSELYKKVKFEDQ